MSKNDCSLMLRFILSLMIVSCGYSMTFTGNVNIDFAAFDFVELNDQIDDVAIPGFAPYGTISGWDIERLMFALNTENDQLSIGVDFVGLAGDVDGNGMDGMPSPWLAILGGVDLISCNGTESICVAFDFNQDETFDLIAGYNGQSQHYHVSSFLGSPMLLPFAFGSTLPQHQGPHLLLEDFEFTLNQVGTFMDLNGSNLSFDVRVFAGGFQDVVGEDFVSGTVTFSVPQPEPVDVSIECLGDEVLLDWTESPGATSYRIYSSTDGGASYSLLATTTELSVSLTVAAAETRLLQVRAAQ